MLVSWSYRKKFTIHKIHSLHCLTKTLLKAHFTVFSDLFASVFRYVSLTDLSFTLFVFPGLELFLQFLDEPKTQLEVGRGGVRAARDPASKCPIGSDTKSTSALFTTANRQVNKKAPSHVITDRRTSASFGADVESQTWLRKTGTARSTVFVFLNNKPSQRFIWSQVMPLKLVYMFKRYRKIQTTSWNANCKYLQFFNEIDIFRGRKLLVFFSDRAANIKTRCCDAWLHMVQQWMTAQNKVSDWRFDQSWFLLHWDTGTQYIFLYIRRKWKPCTKQIIGYTSPSAPEAQ